MKREGQGMYKNGLLWYHYLRFHSKGLGYVTLTVYGV